MEYERTKEGLIQADLAQRLGVVLKQYYEYKLEEEKFEVSLTLAVLQNLLTNCMELFKRLSKKDRKENPLTNELTKNNSSWGISINCVTNHSFNEGKITYEKIFRHLRNSLSHPTALDLECKYLSTGYTTSNRSKSIENIIFISSPDVIKNRIKTFDLIEKAEDWKNRQGTFPKDVKIIKDNSGKYSFSLNSMPFYRCCRVELTPNQLLDLTYALCTYLSHPLQSDWDGETFTIKKLAA